MTTSTSQTPHPFLTTLLTLLLLTNFSNCSTNPPFVNDTERSLLVTLYTSTSGPQWHRQNHWNSSTVPHCSWEGITCHPTTQLVSEINLANNGLSGRFPLALLWGLKGLKHLKLRMNALLFPRQIEKEHIPSHLHRESNPTISLPLVTLDLGATNLYTLDGIISTTPPLNLHYPHLSLLAVDDCDIHGPIPLSILALPSLHTLILSSNSLSGTLPPVDSWMSGATQLTHLRLEDNGITGVIPGDIYKWTKLVVLNLSGNLMEGSIPSRFPVGLERLELGGMYLSGSLPRWTMLGSIKTVNVAGNRLIGPIPPDFLVNSHNLTRLNVERNMLSGLIPDCDVLRGGFDKMLGGNRFIGIEKGLCDEEQDCDRLVCPPGTYALEGRRTQGRQGQEERCKSCPSAVFYGSMNCEEDVLEELEKSIVPSEAVTTLYPTMEQSLFSYDKDISSLEHEREILTLLYNSTSGPQWIQSHSWTSATSSPCTWYGTGCSSSSNIETLDLSANNLIGTLPSQLFLLPHLRRLTISHNPQLVVAFSLIDNEALSLRRLDISQTNVTSWDGIDNVASGLVSLAASDLPMPPHPMPSVIYRLVQLETLRLEHNNFMGRLSSKINQLSQLTTLELGYNQITGTIPSLQHLSQLQSLTLRGNALRGPLRSTLFDNLKQLTHLDLSRQQNGDGGGLTGTIPDFASVTELTYFDVSDNRLTGTIPSDFLLGVTTPPEAITMGHDDGVSSSLFSLSLTVLLAGNHFTGELPEAVCQRLTNQKDFDDYGCNATLCPVGSWNDNGRVSSHDGATSFCKACPGGLYLGRKDCDGVVVVDSAASTITTPPVTVVVPSEREIMEELYNTTRGWQWHRQSHWMSNETSLCEWEGVSCSSSSSSSITGLDLSNNNLEGTLPPRLFLLPWLKTLNLRGNTGLDITFEGVEKAVHLTSLDVSETLLNNVVGLKDLKDSLEELGLEQCRLVGYFPSDVLLLKN